MFHVRRLLLTQSTLSRSKFASTTTTKLSSPVQLLAKKLNISKNSYSTSEKNESALSTVKSDSCTLIISESCVKVNFFFVNFL